MTTGDDAAGEPAPRQTEQQTHGPVPAVERRHQDGVEVLALSGEVDLSKVEEIVPVRDAALAQNPGALVVDLSRVTFADSSVLNLLLRTHARTSMHLAGPLHPVVERLFAVTGISSVLNLHATRDDAVAAARARS